MITHEANKSKPDDNLCVVCREDLGKDTMVLYPDMCFNCVIEEHTKGYVPDNTVNWAIEAKKHKRRNRKKR